MQANWIGRSSGATLRFAIAAESEQAIEVFTTRPDTVFGVGYVVLAPEHALVDQLTTAEQREAVEAFRKSLQSISEQDRVAEDRPKRGVATGGSVQHPFTGEAVPVWIADYVLPDYGTGAVMGVPAMTAAILPLPSNTTYQSPRWWWSQAKLPTLANPRKPSPVWGSWWAPLVDGLQGSRPKPRSSRPPNNAGLAQPRSPSGCAIG